MLQIAAYDMLSRKRQSHIARSRSENYYYQNIRGIVMNLTWSQQYDFLLMICVFFFNKKNLEQWSLRMSWLDLQLMFKQFTPNSPELNQWLETVARAAIDVFLNSTPSNGSNGGTSGTTDHKE